MFELDDKPHEECGVFGVWSQDDMDAAHCIYYGLVALQHRGQESAGIVVCDTKGPIGNICAHKGMGLVSEVFHEDVLQKLHGNIGIGHVRYSTAGASSVENAQPIFYNYSKGTLALAHNGNITNAEVLRKELEAAGKVTGSLTIDYICNAENLTLRLRCHSAAIEAADAILVFSCGVGVQTVADLFPGKRVCAC